MAYIVKKGDTLSKIAQQNKTTVAELAKLNNIKDINFIKEGQSLNLSPASSAGASAVGYGDLENRGGTIYNKATGKGYASPEELAGAMGVKQVDFNQIGKAADYSNLENRGGTIFNTTTEKGYQNPQQLAGDLGMADEKAIDWTQIKSVKEATGLINANNTEAIVNPVPTRTPENQAISKSITDKTGVAVSPETSTMEQMKQAVAPNMPETQPSNLKSQLVDLRAQYSIDKTTEKLNDIQAETDIKRNDIIALQHERDAKKDEMKKAGMTQGFYSGATSKIDQDYNKQINKLQDELNDINVEVDRTNRKLTNDYTAISQIMGVNGQDWENNASLYNQKMENNVQFYNMLNNIDEANKTQKQRDEDNAKSALQTVYNEIKTGGIDLNNMSPDTEAWITKNEVQAGYPVGFYKGIQKAAPDSTVMGTAKWTNSANQEVYTVVTRDEKTGEVKTLNTILGNAKVTKDKADEPTKDEMLVSYKNLAKSTLQSVAGKDGYVSGTDWNLLRKEWASSTQYSTKEFDDAFRGFINPEYSNYYAGFEDLDKNFQKKKTGGVTIVDGQAITQ